MELHEVNALVRRLRDRYSELTENREVILDEPKRWGGGKESGWSLLLDRNIMTEEVWYYLLKETKKNGLNYEWVHRPRDAKLLLMLFTLRNDH